MNIQDINNKTENTLILSGFDNVMSHGPYLIYYSYLKNISIIRYITHTEHNIIMYFTPYTDINDFKSKGFIENIRFFLDKSGFCSLEITRLEKTREIIMHNTSVYINLYEKLLESIQEYKSYADLVDYITAIDILS